MPGKLKRVIRLDSQPLSQTFFTTEGYLMDRPILTSTGIFEYVNPDGSLRRELRLPEEVFDPESLKSYRGKPIIVTHDAGLITKDNVAENAIGTILSEGYRSGSDVRAEIVIHNADELKDCGYRELSLGYNLDLDETPGVYEGEPYDAIQRNIRINHLALVDEARAGDQARLNIDGRDTALKGGKLMKKTAKKKMTRRADSRKRRADGILAPDELKKAIAEYKARREERLAAKADEDDTPVAEETVAAIVPAVSEDDDETIVVLTDDPAEFEAQIEEQLQLVKDRRDCRDEAGDPENLREAEGIIANQDEDISTLFDIIDTLLAQIAFDDGEDETCEGGDEGTNEDDEDEIDESEETNEDDDEESELPDATDDEEDETEFAEDDDDDDIPSTDTGDLASGGVVLNADSIDRIVRERVKIAKAASLLNMDGLESIKPMKAKRTIIKAVKPGVRLDGKSSAYINAMFDLACQELQKQARKDTAYQRKQMFNKDSARSGRVAGNATEAARQKMIRRMQKSK